MKLNRRLFLASLAATFFASKCGAVASTDTRPLVGAIRWDAWYSPGTVPTTAVEKALAPQQYRWRLPFFTKLDHADDSSVKMPLLSQDLMDLEIKQASYGGLDYWAFLGYGANDPMSSALKAYLTSEKRSLVKFCFFTELIRWGNAARPSDLVNEHINLMNNKDYVRVADGRPLYFLGFIDRKTVLEHWGSLAGLGQQIVKFRAQCIAAGAGNPYIVLAGPFAQSKEWSLAGGDAVGAYSLGDPRGIGSYQSLVSLTEQRWNFLADRNLPLVPTVMTGFDRRPRIEHPVPWEPSQKPGDGISFHYDEPRPADLAAHLKNALQFVKSQPADQRAPAVLIYAWNENDEGGWLLPTLPCKIERLKSLQQVLIPGSNLQDPGCAFVR